eukprot:XP_011664671.1 PREDICTED: major facilitator superfamily domain-containing protein 10 [Strongylocentrotus purpuratus]
MKNTELPVTSETRLRRGETFGQHLYDINTNLTVGKGPQQISHNLQEHKDSNPDFIMVSTRRTSYPEPAEVGDQPEGGSETKNSKTHGMVRIIFISLVLDLLAFTMILPLFPTLLDYYGRHDESGLYASLHHSVDQFREVLQIPDTKKYNSVLFGGVLGSLFSLLQFVTSPVIGAASDVYGRRSVMLVTMVGIALSYVLWAMSYNFGIFVLARIVGGIFKGNVSLSTTIVTDISTTKNRGKGMAMIGLAFSVGFIVGPMIGAYFATKGGLFADGAWAVTPALLALTLSIADLLFVFAFLKETLPQEKRAPSMGNSFQERQNLINPFSLFRFSAVKNTNTKEMQILQQLGLSYFLYLFLFSGLEFTLTFLVHIRFQYTSATAPSMGNSFQERQNLINPFSLFRFSAVKNTNTKEMQILQQLGLSYFLYLFLFSGLEFTLTFLVHIRFQYTSMQQGKMFVFMGLIMAALQGGYVRRIKPGQEKRVALTGMLILIPAFVIIAFSSGSFLYYLGLALFSIASGTVVPCMTTIVTMYGPEDQKGTIMGIFRSLGALSRAFGPAAASAVYWGAGAGVCYIWGAVLMVFPIYILTRVIPAKTQ